jgi:hypothetical protein
MGVLEEYSACDETDQGLSFWVKTRWKDKGIRESRVSSELSSLDVGHIRRVNLKLNIVPGIYPHINVGVFGELGLDSKDNARGEDSVARVDINNEGCYLRGISGAESYLRRVLETFAVNYKVDIKVVYGFLCYLDYFRLWGRCLKDFRGLRYNYGL